MSTATHSVRSQYHRSLAQEKLATNLAVRECISRLCLNSEDTLEVLMNRRGTNFANVGASSHDHVQAAAMSILKKLFRSLKTDICRAGNDELVYPSEVIQYLASSSHESSLEIVQRYAHERKLKQNGYLQSITNKIHSPSSKARDWRQLEIEHTEHSGSMVISDDRYIKQRLNAVPLNVPPLDPVQVRQCSSPWSSPASSAKNSSQSRRDSGRQKLKTELHVISDHIIPPEEESSSSSSSSISVAGTEEAAQELKQLSMQVAREVITSVRQVQEVVASPRSGGTRAMSLPFCGQFSPLRLVDRSSGPTPRDGQQRSASAGRVVEWESKGVQTNGNNGRIEVAATTQILKVDAATKMDANDFQPTEAMENLSSSAILSTNNSSSISNSIYSSSSNYSAGQISMHKAALLLARSKYNLVGVNADGSCCQQLNSPCFTGKSNAESQDPVMTSTPNLRFEKLPTGHSGTPGRVTECSDAEQEEEVQDEAPHFSFNTPQRPTPSRLNAFYRSSNILNRTSGNRGSPQVREWNPSTYSESIRGDGTESLVLMAKEMSLGTSFDLESSSPRDGKDEDLHSIRGGNDDDMEVKEEIEIIKGPVNKHALSQGSSSSANAKSHISSYDEDEESTLNQVSPLPTSG